MPAEQRRAQLIETATRIFSRHGFHGTTTRQIARAAQVNEAMIFRFFPRKEDLYTAILEAKSDVASATDWIADLRRTADAGDDRAVIDAVVRRVVEHHFRDPDFMRLGLFSALEHHGLSRSARLRWAVPLYSFLREYIAARQRDGRFRPGEPKAIARAILAVPWYHSLIEALGAYFPVSADQACDAYTDFILGGLHKSAVTSSRAADAMPRRAAGRSR
jgi:AcrR family transcriptional regulator